MTPLVSSDTMNRLRSLAERYKKENPESNIFADFSDTEILRSFLFAGEIQIKKMLGESL